MSQWDWEQVWHRDKLKQGSVKDTESLAKYCERQRIDRKSTTAVEYKLHKTNNMLYKLHMKENRSKAGEQQQ